MKPVVHIKTPAPNLEKALEFYSKLGFNIVEKGAIYIAISAQITIQIDPNPLTRPGIVLYLETTDINALNPLSIQDQQVIVDPNGVYCYLESLNNLPSIDESEQNEVLGNLAGLGVETIDFTGSITFWEKLGFSITMGGVDQGWVQLTHPSGMGCGIMKYGACPHSFTNPSLTYFNGKNNLAIIQSIRKLQIPIHEEITVFNPKGEVDNIILRDPGGYGFFIYND